MKSWKRIEPTSFTKVGWRTITSKTFIMPDGEKAIFDTLHQDGQEFVCIIALTKEGKIVIASEFCPGPELDMYELPGGFVDKGEEPEKAIQREFFEETGYEAKELKYLGSFHKDKYMNATWHAFFATGCVRIGDQALESEEFIDVMEITIDEFLRAAKNDKVTDHGAILMAYDLLQERLKKYETTN